MNEAKDSLQSRALLSILDLIGEGEIEGLVNGERSIFFNETPLRNADGTYNFNGVTTAGTYGTNTQSPLTGFGNSVETPFNIGVKLNALTPYTFSVTNSAADLARVIINIPALSKTNPENGDIDGTTVQYKFQLSINGGAFQDVEVDAAYVDNVTWAQVGGYWQVTAAAGSSKLIASITATSTGNGVGQIVVQPQEFNGSTWVNLGETKTVDVIGAWESTYSEAPTFKTRASLSMPVESVYNTVRFVPVSTRLDSGTSIQLAQGNASYWKRSATVSVSGKTRSKYQRSHILRLPTPRTSAQIRVTRVTADAADSLTVNETWIESFTEITSLNINYPNSALVGVRIDAQQFNSIPSRAYLVDGLKIQVPSNYNPVTRTYTGIWNGTFQTAYSNNPAWVLYDLLTNNRYGLGNYIASTQVDKAALYTIGKYCDEIVPDGFGGSEPRFTINTVIQSAADAYKVITDITSAFRGMAFWDGGAVGFTQDAPADPSMLYTNANVVEGMFTYTGSSRRDRHSVVHVTWNDPADNYRRKIEYVEDSELIQRFGIRRVDTLAFGCTSRGQAARVGRWILYTERYESDVIQFKVGLDAAFMAPGEIIKIHDKDKSGKRFGGRLVSFTNTTATLDSPVTLTTGTATISLMLPDGTFAERTLNQTPGTHTNVSWTTPLTQLPVADAVWMLSQASLEPTLARVIGISQGENNTFEIAAIEHNPTKFGAIEQGLTLQARTTSIIDAKFVDTPESLRVVERSILNSIGQPEVKLSISWYGNATTHEVAYRNISEDRGGNWTTATVTNETFFELTDPSKGEYEIAITAINPLGRRSKTARINFIVAGKLVNNDLPTALTIRPLFSGIALTWTNAGNKDFAGVEIWRSTTNVLLSAIRLDAVTTSTYSDMSVDFEDGEHFYWIRAFDTYGNYTSYVGPVNGVALDLPDSTTDNSTPPAPTGLTATAGLATVMLEWASPAYTNHKTTEVWASVSNTTVASATLVGSTDTTMFAHALGTTGATRYYWIRFKSKADINGPYNAVAGVSATTGKVGNTDLGPLVVEAGNLANGAVTVDKILAGAVDTAKFASGIEPVTIVTGSTVPTTKSTNTIFLAGTGKLYRWNGTAYIATVPTGDLSGTIADAQIAGLAASKVTGQLTDAQIADVAAAKMTGQLVSTQIADAAISTAKFASSIRPVEIVSTLPSTGNFAGRMAFLTTDNKLYRHNGTAWVSSVASADISGTIADAQIAALAASKVTGQLSNSQIADLAAAKLTGTISASQIADGSVSGTKFASGIEPVTVVSSVPGTKSTNAIFNTADGKLYRWNGSAYVATVPAADLSGTVSDAQIAGLAASKISGQVIASQIADAAVTTAKFAAGIEPITVVASVPGTKSTNSIFNTTDGKVYRWNGTAYVTTVSAADISGTLAAAQIASVAASQVTGQLSDTQLAAIGAAKVTGQIVGTQITDGAISTAKLAAGSVTAATIAADTITASQIAANAITSAELAAGAVVAGKIAAGSIQAGDIAAGTITGDKLAANTITASQIAADTITAGQIAAGAISASELAAGAVTAGKIAAGAVTANEIAANAITAGKIDAAAVTTAKIAAGAVTATEIATGAITAGKIAAGAVTATEIAADTITAAQIAAGAISASELAAGAVTAGKIAANAVTATEIAAGSITTAKIAATAVTANEIAANAITAAKIDAGAVTTAKLAAGAVTANEIAATTITGAKIAAGTITGSNIAADTITAGQIAAGAISASEIASSAITTDKLAAGAVTANEIASNAITAAKIDAGAVTTAKLVAGAVTANEIAANAITAAKIDAGAVTAAKIAAGSIDATKIAVGTITANEIASNTITGAKIAADTITAGQIAAGAIGASEIAAGAITTSKLLVTGAGAAINDDPNTQDASAWTGGTIAIVSDTTSPTTSALQITSTGSTTLSVRSFPLDAVKNYNLRVKARQVSGTSTSYLLVAFFNSAGALLDGSSYPTGWPGVGTYHYFGRVNQTIPTSWTEYSISFGPDEVAKIPTGAARVQVGFLANYNGSGEQRYTSVRLMEKAAADLIVDGAIGADKIAANAITAGKLAANSIAVGTAAIQNGAIVNAMIGTAAIDDAKIATATITSAKIASLSVDKLTAGNLAINQYIRSNSYTAGSSGWAINADGTAEFGAASIRGQLTASQINSNGLTIKDNSGNILFGVGNPVDFANVGGTTKPAANATKNTITQGTFAARPTGSDGDFYYATDTFTLYQKISGAWVESSNRTALNGSGQLQGVSSGAGTTVANSQITISGGAISGIGTGNGTAVANSSVTLSSTGALQNAGGGQMTTLIASDTRNDNQAPSWYAAGLTEEFKNRSAIGAPGSATYGILRTEKPWTDASGGVVTQTFKSEEGEWKRTSTPGSYATWTSWAPKADRQLSSSNISTFVANDAIGISQIGTTLQTTNFSSTAGWQINKSGTATFNDVALRGAVNSGSFTNYAWPASGSGFHLGPSGLLLGNYNVVLGNGKRRYFQVEASGNVYSPGFNIVDGDAVFSGTVSANVINTDAIIGGAASAGVATTSTGASASVVVSVPAGTSAVLIEYYLGPQTVTPTGGGGKNDPGGFTYGPILTGLTANGATAAGVIVGPTPGAYTVTCTRSYYTGTMRLAVLVLKR
jgi:predicted phage tail protein